ncbi:MAG: hypothetical protein NVS2B7_19930 [Herpetosiphon sp.]
MNKNDVTARLEEEKIRVQEQSQLIYLQNQIDELRRMIKDQNNKYAWAMEQARRAEGQVAQLQNVIERQTQEMQGSLEVFKREISNVRRDISATAIKAEEAAKPLREMQAGIHQLSESRRQEREAIAPWLVRIEESEHQQRELIAHIREAEEHYRHLQTHHEQLRLADDGALEEIRRLNDQMEIEKQVLRRQSVETQQLVSDVRTSLDEPVSRIGHLEERYKVIEDFVKTLPPQIEQTAIQLPGIHEEARRIELISTERFLMNQERLEDLRHQIEVRLEELHDTDDQHLRHLTAWLERIDGWTREQEGRVSRIANRLELLHHRHDTRLSDLELQELQTLEHITAAWNESFELVRRAQAERREHMHTEEGVQKR